MSAEHRRDPHDDGSEPPLAPGNRLSLRALFRQASGLSAASLVVSVASIPVSFLTARWLGPRDFGRAQFVLLLYLFASLARTGTFEGAVRAYVDHISRGEPELATKVQNVGVSFETACSILPGLAMLAIAALMGDPLRRAGFVLAPIAVTVASLSSYFGGLYSARARFDIVTRANLIRGLAAPALVLSGIPIMGAAAVFVAPAIADLVTIAYFASRRPGLDLRLDFDREWVRKLFRNGFPLGAIAVVYWAYRLAGSTSMAFGATASAYGVYVFAAAPVGLLSRAIAGVHAVLTPAVWGELSDPVEDPRWFGQAHRITIALALLAGVTTNLSQAGFASVVVVALPQFRGAITLFSILAFNIFLLSVAAIPALVLSSARVNRQAANLGVWLVALVVNVVANVIVLGLGGGGRAVAVNDVWIQLLAVCVVFAMAWGYLGEHRLKMRTVATVGLLLALTLATGAALRAVEPPSHLTVRWTLDMGVRIVAVVLTWGVAARMSGLLGPHDQRSFS